MAEADYVYNEATVSAKLVTGTGEPLAITTMAHAEALILIGGSEVGTVTVNGIAVTLPVNAVVNFPNLGGKYVVTAVDGTGIQVIALA